MDVVADSLDKRDGLLPVRDDKKLTLNPVLINSSPHQPGIRAVVLRKAK